MLTVEQQYGIEESLVSCQVQDKEVQGTPLRLEPESLVFEIHDPEAVLQVSQVIGELALRHGDAVLYKGRAVVKSLVHTGLRIICEAGLDSAITRERRSGVAELSRVFDEDFVKWQRQFHISPEFKVIIADVEDFLLRVRQWLEQREFGCGQAGARAAAGRDSELLEAIAGRVVRSFNVQHERFEELIYSAPPERRHLHHAFAGRHWKRLFLGCPFGHRTYHKPLGYAGDYEMMNMIHRNQPEGGSTYDRLMHFLLVSQWPALAVRNRAAHLTDALLAESARVTGQGRRCRILNIGCGPAREVQCFLEQSPLSGHADFSFIDFNEETLLHARERFDALCRQFNRQARLQTRVLSVYQLLKRGMPASGQAGEKAYDVIYCSGLFDYLADETCRSLVRLLFRSLNSHGLMIVGNMKDDRPFRNFIESVLDWHLVYRDARKMATLGPAEAAAACTVEAEATGVNLFLHVRKCR